MGGRLRPLHPRRVAILLPRSQGMVRSSDRVARARHKSGEFPDISRFWVLVPGSEAPKFPLRPTGSDD